MSMLARLATFGGAKPRPTYVATGVRSSSGAGTVTINKPTGLQVGDLMVASFASGSTNAVAWTQLSGWTEVLDSGTDRPCMGIQWKVATSADVSASNFTFQSSSGGANYNGVICAYRGAAFDVAGTATRANGSSVTVSAISVSEASSILLGFFFADGNNKTVSSAPSGMTQLALNSIENPTTAAYSQNVEAGSSGTKSITFSGNNAAGVLCSIKPA